MNNSSMTTSRTFRHLALPLALALPLVLPVSVSAQESGAYVGLGAGRAYADIDSGGLAAAFQRGGYRIGQIKKEENDYNFKVLGGYNFNPNIALEGSYFDLGKFDFDTTLLPAATQSGKASNLRGFALDLVGTLPVRDKLSAFGRLGVNNAKVEQDFSGNTIGTGLANRSDRGWNEKYGIGLQYAVNDAFSLRAELERYRIEDNRILKDRVDTFTISAVFRLGGRRQAAPVVQTPAPSAPAPAPVRAPEPAPTLPIELTLAANTLFDFDRTELKTEGRQALDNLVRDMRTLDYDVVLVTGHTDRIGTREYNIGLSERRAEAVKNYLVSAGVPAARITTRGVNSDEPVTRPDQCRNTGSAQAQIACLQPDRRVVILVTGTNEPQ
ncbi:MAG: OmpA family protein [Gammaproteobacteria bacterium]|nr:OmpA family protein [Gammaproteobacteria bacterium]MDP2139997.1 OmpA family protein [Gammaproteobacteria bacterium]MDP2347817.1 OmpA family protein [Gammaproteobacteria bacterium]